MKTKESINCCVSLMEVGELFNDKKEAYLPPNEEYSLKIQYPLKEEFSFSIKTGAAGMKQGKILFQIYQTYKNIYKNMDKYGIWGHSMGELYIEGVEIDHKGKTISLHMGS